MAKLDFPANPTTGQIYTGDNGVSYTWTGTYWSAGDGTAGKYVLVAGDTMTGDLLVAADSDNFAKLETAGVIKLETNQAAMAAQSALQVKYQGTQNAAIDYDGSATFANDVIIGDPSSTYGVQFNYRGAAYIRADGLANTTDIALGVYSGGFQAANATASITKDGDVQAKDFYSRTTSLPSTSVAGYYVGGGNGIYISSDTGNPGGSTLWQGFSTNLNKQTSLIGVDGSAMFADTITTGTFNPGSNGTFGIELGVEGACSVQRLASEPSDRILFRGLWGAQATTLITTKGDATFTGNVTGSNTFLALDPNDPTNVLDVKDQMTKLIAAVTAIRVAAQASGTLDDLKTAITTATADFDGGAN